VVMPDGHDDIRAQGVVERGDKRRKIERLIDASGLNHAHRGQPLSRGQKRGAGGRHLRLQPGAFVLQPVTLAAELAFSLAVPALR
jgi:hypothetical protein